MKLLARASKPDVPTKTVGDQHYASEVNAIDTAIDDVIDDYVSQTDTNDQTIASKVTVAAGKSIETDTINETTGASGVTVDNCLIKDGLAADSNLLEGSTKAQVQDHGVQSIKKTGEASLTGDVELDQGASIGLTQVGQKITVAYTGGAGAGEPHQAEDFLVVKDGAVWKARHGDTGAITYSDALIEKVVQSVMGALSGSYPHLVVIRGNV